MRMPVPPDVPRTIEWCPYPVHIGDLEALLEREPDISASRVSEIVRSLKTQKPDVALDQPDSKPVCLLDFVRGTAKDNPKFKEPASLAMWMEEAIRAGLRVGKKEVAAALVLAQSEGSIKRLPGAPRKARQSKRFKNDGSTPSKGSTLQKG